MAFSLRNWRATCGPIHPHHFLKAEGGGTKTSCHPPSLKSAVARVIKEGKVRTYDMGGKNTTIEVAKEVAKYAA